MIKTKQKLIIGVVLVCFLMVNVGFVNAYSRSSWNRWASLKASFAGLASLQKQSLTSMNSPLEKLSRLQQRNSASIGIYIPHGITGPFNRLIPRKGVEVSALVKLSQFDRLSQLSSNLAATSIKPSFANLAKLPGNPSDIYLKPSFTRLADLSGGLTGTTLKPSLERMASLSSTTPGTIKPAFERFTNLVGPGAGGLKPEFMRLANLDHLNTSSVGLKPSFSRLATLSDKFSITINPSFAKLVDLNRNNLGAVNPDLVILGAQPTTLSGITLAYDKRLAQPGLPILQGGTDLVLFRPLKTTAMKNFNPEGQFSIAPQENAPFISRDLAKVGAQAAAQQIFHKDVNPAQLQGLPLLTPKNIAPLSGLEGAEISATAH